MNRILAGLWIVALLCGVSAAAAAEEEVDEMTIYGTDRSKIDVSDVTDTRGIAVRARVDTIHLQDGMATGESQLDREEGRAEKPKLDQTDREKPDLTPDVTFQVDWKLMLLIGLLESAGAK